MEFNLPFLITFIIAIILIVFLTILISFLFVKFSKNEIISHKIRKVFIEIDTKELKVRLIDNKNKETYEYLLDDYIYMISKNPSSKDFRDFLKAINNKIKKTEIKKKLELLESDYVFEFEISEKKQKVTQIFINTNFDDSGIIRIQGTEYYSNPEKSFFDKHEELILGKNEDQIFELVKKDIASFKAKRWSLIKIDFKDKSFKTKKELHLQKMQLEKIVSILKEVKMITYVHEENFIYAVAKTGRSSKPSSVWKYWMQYLSSQINNKKIRDFLNLSFSDLEISTSSQKGKEKAKINAAFIRVAHISNLKSHGKFTSKNLSDVELVVSDVLKNVKNINREILEGKNFLKHIEYEIKERSYKGIIELFLNLPFDQSENLFKYNAYKKIELIKNVLNETIKIAMKNSDKIVTFFFNSNLSYLVSKASNNLNKAPNNFYISLSLNKSDNFGLKWKEDFENIRKNEYNLLQFVRYSNKYTKKFYRDMEPQVVVFSKLINALPDEEQKENINRENLIRNIDKNTKILNIK